MDVLNLIGSRQIWHKYRDVYRQAPEAAQSNATFANWLTNNYFLSAAVRVRRQCRWKDKLTIARLLVELCSQPHVLNWQRFRQGRLDETQEEAAAKWCEFKDPEADRFNGEIAKKDLEELLSKSDAVIAWVNKVGAHRDPGAPPGLSESDLDQAIDALAATFKRYYGLFCGSDIETAISFSAWERIFTVAWIGDWEAYLSQASRY